jgi:hypothetical protein
MRRAITITLAIACSIALSAATSLAAPGPKPKLDKKQLHPKTCGTGQAVISVVQKVVNDVDSGTKGNYWAFDSYTRHIKVWRTGTNVYCAIVRYNGKFTTLAGFSPGGTTSIPAGIKGRFEGGYRMDFTGTLLPNPAKPTHGSIGTFDYQCTSAGVCPGSVYWVSLYFTGVAGDDFDWWGWIYRAGKGSGTWLNSITGSKGDIVPPKAKHDDGHRKDDQGKKG